MWIPDLEGRQGPKYLRIADAMADDIAGGRLTAGTRLPPHRELAYRLGVSANTTSRAYAEGVRRALLRGEVGRGTFVRPPEAVLRAGESGNLRRAGDGPIDLSRNLPLPGLAERHVRRAIADISRRTSLSALLDYQTGRDIDRHLSAAISWVTDQGVPAGSGEIVTTNGAQHAILCALMALTQPGDLLLTEALTYAPIHAMAQKLGLRTATLRMDAEGLLPDAFEEVCRRAAPRVLYIVPTFQCPTAATASAGRRQAIASIAERHGVLIVEDDVFGMLASARPAPIAAVAPDCTLYLTSMSKCVAPGLRVGYLRAPERLVPALRHAVNLTAWMTPPLTSEIVATLVLEGSASELAAEQRRAAGRRQALADGILGPAADGCSTEGLHRWLTLPDGWKADMFQAMAARRGVLVAAAREFAAAAGDAPEAIRICLSHEADESRVAQGLSRIADLLRLPPIGAPMEI